MNFFELLEQAGTLHKVTCEWCNQNEEDLYDISDDLIRKEIVCKQCLQSTDSDEIGE